MAYITKKIGFQYRTYVTFLKLKYNNFYNRTFIKKIHINKAKLHNLHLNSKTLSICSYKQFQKSTYGSF